MTSSRRGGDFEDDLPEVVPDYTDEIRAALRVLRRTEEEDHEEVIDQIRRAGVGSGILALRLYQLIPIAWGRFFLVGMGVHVPDEYFIRDRRTGELIRDRFSECELYQQVRETLMPEFGRAAKHEHERLLWRSSEYNAFRQQMKAGARPENLMLAPPVLT